MLAAEPPSAPLLDSFRLTWTFDFDVAELHLSDAAFVGLNYIVDVCHFHKSIPVLNVPLRQVWCENARSLTLEIPHDWCAERDELLLCNAALFAVSLRASEDGPCVREASLVSLCTRSPENALIRCSIAE
eukprot:gnl/Spiro4/4957_TR2469_c0_g1_i1.p1 gnl/Spiro4/4957_TR2469_c0_g1~~gnl/Spiro4/4957_TR2469_c0_g1_i1.p1  ORF type:complete len:130 (+),score=16.41 gnl/Spiro4/4957_TR2469_c0_g1_i1:77-466(+)